MGLESQEIAERNRWHRAMNMALILMLFGLLALGVTSFYYYAQDQLYRESIAQLKEIAGQIYEKLGIELDYQWSYLERMDENQRDTKNMRLQEFTEYIDSAQSLLSPADDALDLIAVDEQGFFYDAHGRQGLWSCVDHLTDRERSSFLTSYWSGGKNYVAFARRLRHPQEVAGHTIRYYVLLQPIETIAPLFRSSCFQSPNTTYVMDENGTKMFEDSVVEELDFQGRNLEYSLEKLDYLHLDGYQEFQKKAQEESFACTDVRIHGHRYYMALNPLAQYSWSMLTVVPAEEVAVSTGSMLQSLLGVAILMMVVFVGMLVIVIMEALQYLKNRELLEIKIHSENQLTESNHKLQKLQRAQQEALEYARSASRAKSDFLANMSHDIRTPMNAIVGLASLMEHEPDLSDSMCNYIQKIQMSSRHLLGLINDILDMSKIEAQEIRLVEEPVDIKDQVGQVDAIIRTQAEQKNQSVQIHFRNIRHRYLMADGIRLRQILLNLLSNAVKYTADHGRITLDIEEMESGEVQRARYRFVVTDNGCGMSEDFLEHIYEIFTRTENSTTNKVQGTGLGMAITKNLVDLMGGEIRVESRIGQGTRFEVTLEWKIDVWEQERQNRRVIASREKAVHEGSPLAGMHFLCAEDNALNAEILRELLELYGATCKICNNGVKVVEAFEASGEGEYDAVLMDVQMPGMNGLEAAKAIRAGKYSCGHAIPIIAMTANVFSEDVDRCMAAGMDAHIPKPIDITVLEKIIARWEAKG